MSDAKAAGRELAPLVLRLALGVAFLLHGAQKLDLLRPDSALPKTALSDVSFDATRARIEGMADKWALEGWVPEAYKRPLTWGAAVAELVGGLLVALGAFTRVGALSIASVMGVAVWKVHGPHGFFAQNSGYEYNALILAVCAYLLLAGPGKLALDSTLLKKKEGPPQK